MQTQQQRYSEELLNKIEGMTNAERKELRKAMESQGLSIPNSLYFNYQTQEWID